jgi:hypothetical protein
MFFFGAQRSSHSSDPSAQVAPSSFSLRGAWSARPVRLIIYFGFLLVLAIAMVGGIAISKLRDNILANSKLHLQNIASVLAQDVGHAFDAVTLTQVAFVQQMQPLHIVSSRDFDERMSGDDIHLMLRERIVNLRPIHGLMLANSQGRVINDSGDWPIPSHTITTH